LRLNDLVRFAVTWILSRREGLRIYETLHIFNSERRNIVALVRQELVETSVLSGNWRPVRIVCAMRQFVDDRR